MLIVQYSYYHLVTSKHLVTDKVSYRKIVAHYRMESSKRSFCFTVFFIQQVKQIGKSLTMSYGVFLYSLKTSEKSSFQGE